MHNKIFLFLIGIAYALLMLAYGTEPLIKLFGGLAEPVVSFILLIIVLLPIFALADFAGKLDAEKENTQISGHWAEMLWRGDIPLVTAFFVYNLLGSCLITLCIQYVFHKWANLTVEQVWMKGLVLAILGFGFHLITTIGTLRSARKYSDSGNWIVFARVGVFITSIFIALGLVFALFGLNIFSRN